MKQTNLPCLDQIEKVIFSYILDMFNQPSINIELVRSLLKTYPKICFYTFSNKNLLYEAIEKLNYEAIAVILEFYKDQTHCSNVVNYPLGGQTPLSIIGIKNNDSLNNECKAIIELLIKYGANKEAALWRAVEFRKANFVKLLAEHGADVNTCINGKIPLTIAVKAKELTIVEILLNHGANIKLACSIIPNYSYLHEAILSEDDEMVSIFIKKSNLNVIESAMVLAKDEYSNQTTLTLLQTSLNKILCLAYCAVKSSLPDDLARKILGNLLKLIDKEALPGSLKPNLDCIEDEENIMQPGLSGEWQGDSSES